MVRSPMRAAVLAFVLTIVTSALDAHPEHEWDEVRLLVHAFASAHANDNVEALGKTLAPHGRFAGRDREDYLATVAGSPDVTGVVIEYATYEPVEGGVRVSPIVEMIDSGTFQIAWSATAARVGDEWRLVALEPTADFPAELVSNGLAEHSVTFPVAFSLIDASSRAPAFARVHIADEKGRYWPPRGHQQHIRLGWRENVGGDVHIAGKTYAYVPPTFVADLPAGDFTIEVVKGIEHDPVVSTFSVDRARSEAMQIAVPRWADMRAKGWYSGDTHVHFLDDHTALLELQAEDLNVINVLATKWGELITNAEHVTGAPSRLSTAEGIVYFNEETRHGWLGHTILHRLKSLVYPLTWGGPSEGVRGGFDFPPMAHQADKAHAQGGMVTWAHFPSPGGEVAVDIALGKIDSIDLFTWGDAFADRPMPAGPPAPGAASYWYKFLNTGFKLPATAGTDKMLNVQVVGSVRTYAHVADTFDYDRWLEAVRAGRTFVTTGPLISLTANGKPIGATLELAPGDVVDIDAEVVSPFDRYPVDALEIVAGGEVVASTRNPKESATLRASARIRADRSTWVAARARGSKTLPYQIWSLIGATGVPPMAHTSPIYLRVAGEPARSPGDARFLAASVDRAISWARDTAKFQHESQRAEMVALFEQAKRAYIQMSPTDEEP